MHRRADGRDGGGRLLRGGGLRLPCGGEAVDCESDAWRRGAQASGLKAGFGEVQRRQRDATEGEGALGGRGKEAAPGTKGAAEVACVSFESTCCDCAPAAALERREGTNGAAVTGTLDLRGSGRAQREEEKESLTANDGVITTPRHAVAGSSLTGMSHKRVLPVLRSFPRRHALSAQAELTQVLRTWGRTARRQQRRSASCERSVNENQTLRKCEGREKQHSAQQLKLQRLVDYTRVSRAGRPPDVCLTLPPRGRRALLKHGNAPSSTWCAIFHHRRVEARNGHRGQEAQGSDDGRTQPHRAQTAVQPQRQRLDGRRSARMPAPLTAYVNGAATLFRCFFLLRCGTLRAFRESASAKYK